jgi:hypothetical protein
VPANKRKTPLNLAAKCKRLEFPINPTSSGAATIEGRVPKKNASIVNPPDMAFSAPADAISAGVKVIQGKRTVKKPSKKSCAINGKFSVRTDILRKIFVGYESENEKLNGHDFFEPNKIENPCWIRSNPNTIEIVTPTPLKAPEISFCSQPRNIPIRKYEIIRPALYTHMAGPESFARRPNLLQTSGPHIAMQCQEAKKLNITMARNPAPDSASIPCSRWSI